MELDMDLMTLREELQNLPEHMGMYEFEDRPVEGYGAAIMEGYGWTEGRGIGRNAVADVKVMEVKRNIGTAGLGFKGDSNGSADLAKKLPKKLEELGVRAKGVDEDIREGSLCVKFSGRVNWLRNNIRVRITTKELKGGRLFLKRGVVFDVIGPGMCNVSIDETGELVEGLKEEMLEIVMPKCGDLVVVLEGRLSGAVGRLVELDLDTGKGTICHVDSHELLSVMADQIAEFTGDVSDIGY